MVAEQRKCLSTTRILFKKSKKVKITVNGKIHMIIGRKLSLFIIFLIINASYETSYWYFFFNIPRKVKLGLI